MPTYQRITIAVSGEEDIEIKRRAKEKGLSVSAFCREKILGAEIPLERVTVEAEIDKLAQAQKHFTQTQIEFLNRYVYNSNFMSNLFYYFMISAADESVAKSTWEQAEAATKK